MRRNLTWSRQTWLWTGCSRPRPSWGRIAIPQVWKKVQPIVRIHQKLHQSKKTPAARENFKPHTNDFEQHAHGRVSEWQIFLSSRKENEANVFLRSNRLTQMKINRLFCKWDIIRGRKWDSKKYTCTILTQTNLWWVGHIPQNWIYKWKKDFNTPLPHTHT